MAGRCPAAGKAVNADRDSLKFSSLLEKIPDTARRPPSAYRWQDRVIERITSS